MMPSKKEPRRRSLMKQREGNNKQQSSLRMVHRLRVYYNPICSTLGHDDESNEPCCRRKTESARSE